MKQHAIILLITFSLYNCGNKKLIIESPIDGTITENKEIIIKGIVPDNHSLEINGTKISGKSQFSQKFQLDKKVNQFELKSYKDEDLMLMYDEKISITVIRKFNKKDEQILEQKELVERERIIREERIENQKQLATERAWNNSKAGRIYHKHPEWEKDDCEKLAKGNIWIGMDFKMLKYQRGLPNIVNPSNYGGGVTHWQLCWSNWTPSCFYDDDEDGKVDSYN